MAVKRAIWGYNQGWPVLIVELDQGTAEIIGEQRPQYVEAGLVFLGAPWEKKVPPITWGSPPAETVLRGFTRDREVLRLFREFRDALDRGAFKPGVRKESK